MTSSPSPTFTAYADCRRVGVLVIPDEIVATEEISTLLPVGDLIFHHHRVEFDEIDTPANRTSALACLRDAVRIIGRVRPQAVVFACTSGGAFAGAKFHDEILEQMRAALPGVQICTAVDAVARVLTAIGARRVAVGTPYSDDIVAALLDVLVTRGIDVVRTAKLFPAGYPDPWTVMSTRPEMVAEFAQSINDDRADAVFVSCTGLTSTPVISQVERAIGKPFVTSNIAIARVLQEALGLGPVGGFGSILATKREPAR